MSSFKPTSSKQVVDRKPDILFNGSQSESSDNISLSEQDDVIIESIEKSRCNSDNKTQHE